MFHGGMCKCPHHKVVGLFVLLAWVAGVLFFWTSYNWGFVWGQDSQFYFQAIIVLLLLGLSTKACKCCWRHHGMNMGQGSMCKHEPGCTCGDCERCK